MSAGFSGASARAGRALPEGVSAHLMSCVEYAMRSAFLPDARVKGYLIDADIGPVCYGRVFGNDCFERGQFIRFEAVGLDNRNNYDLVRVRGGSAYVIVSHMVRTQLESTLYKGVGFLRRHIAANPDHYRGLMVEWTSQA